ncbi:MAG: hypothetical protein JWM81_44 [Candidatus Saccharibacteria bacterium]|nr:hypothetical protein [Candidatus Saccharibacteria bacterium]
MDEEKTTSSKDSAKKSSLLTTGTLLVGIAIVLVVGIGGFIGGMQFQKGKTGPGVATAASNFSHGFSGGMNGRAMNGSFGAVTAISTTSLSVQDRRSSTAKTYSITSSTTITNNGAAATASDIAVGDNVIVRTASADSTEATSIALNPTMGGPSNTESDPTTEQ